MTYLNSIGFLIPFESNNDPNPETVCKMKNSANGIIIARCNSKEFPLFNKLKVNVLIIFEVCEPAPNPEIPSKIDNISRIIDVFFRKLGL